MIFFGLPVTLGAVGVLEGRQCVPGEAFGRPHHPLMTPEVAGAAVSVPGGEIARQESLNCESVNLCE